jgi:hypothetical protein
MYQKIPKIGKRALAVSIIGLVIASLAIANPVVMFAPKADAASTCQTLAIGGVAASGYETVNPPSNAIDNSLNTRWSNYGIGSWIRADLGKQQTVCSVDVAWYHGNTRTNNFVIAVSSDGTSYTNVYSGKSSGTTAAAERYSFAEITARYMRITVNGNSQNMWASISEIDVNGYTPLADTAAPSIKITSPLTGSTLSQQNGKITVQGTASDNSGLQVVELRIDDGNYAAATPKAADDWSIWSIAIDVGSSGSYRLVSRATDKAGNQAWDSINVSVSILPADTTRDKFGIEKIYQTKTGGNEWYVNMADPKSDSMFRNLPSMTKQSDGSWQVSASQVRMEAWSPENKKWQNVEITEYAKIVGGSNELLQMYSRGGHHTDSNQCLGSAYKGRLYGDGHAAFVKEITHPAYAGNRGTVQVTNTPLEGRWVGFKAVIYNFVENGKTYVHMESYIDDDVTDSNGNLVIKNNWKLASVVEDKGGWSSNDSDFNASCFPTNMDSTHQYRQRDEIHNLPGGTSTQNIAAFRSDDLTWDWKYLSVREIQAP